MEETINLLKEQVTEKGNAWRETNNNELVIDCIALVDAINALEERIYGERITTINYMLS